MALRKDLGDAHIQYLDYARKHYREYTYTWNTNDLDNFRTVLERIEPEKVPECLRRKNIPYRWHCWWGSSTWYESWEGNGEWLKRDKAGAGSCFTVVEWWASLHALNDG